MARVIAALTIAVEPVQDFGNSCGLFVDRLYTRVALIVRVVHDLASMFARDVGCAAACRFRTSTATTAARMSTAAAE